MDLCPRLTAKNVWGAALGAVIAPGPLTTFGSSDLYRPGHGAPTMETARTECSQRVCGDNDAQSRGHRGTLWVLVLYSGSLKRKFGDSVPQR